MPQPHARVTAESLRTYAEGNVPEYLVPARFVVVDVLPRSPNGKLDLAALETAESAVEGVAHIAPRDAIEQQLVAVWEDVLGVKPIGINDRFFDLGGHSLLAARVVARIRSRLEVDLPIRAIFEALTVAELAALVDRAREHAGSIEREEISFEA